MKDITMEITFTIENDSTSYDGRAYPEVDSGSQFGGRCDREDIPKIVESEKKWLEESYGRKAVPKITVKDLTKKQSTLGNFAGGDSRFCADEPKTRRINKTTESENYGW